MLDLSQQKVLWACTERWRSTSIAENNRLICFEWIVPTFEEQFHETFHQSVLDQLSKLSYLKKGDSSRGGGRRYYTIPDLNKCEEAIRDLKVAPNGK